MFIFTTIVSVLIFLLSGSIFGFNFAHRLLDQVFASNLMSFIGSISIFAVLLRYAILSDENKKINNSD